VTGCRGDGEGSAGALRGGLGQRIAGDPGRAGESGDVPRGEVVRVMEVPADDELAAVCGDAVWPG
jgi:hypothetical protein